MSFIGGTHVTIAGSLSALSITVLSVHSVFEFVTAICEGFD
nr:MAG TPA: hypothetical protein [Caudoviricetes sp.]